MVSNWTDRIVTPSKVLAAIKPGMSIFVSTGMAEPRTLVRHLKAGTGSNLQDLEIVQLMSLGDVISSDDHSSDKYRVKTFHSGCLARSAISAGSVDLIPSRFSRIPGFFKSGTIQISVAFIQITPPDEMGYASLGVSVDVARYVMEQASLVVGEINDHIPRTLGDTLVHVNEFDYFVQSTEPPLYIRRWIIPEVYKRIAANIASILEDGSCISFSLGPLYEALGKELRRKRDLGAHTLFFTDALMDLVEAGALTNLRKRFYRGASLASYALGTSALIQWLNRNPIVEFHPIDMVMDFKNIAQIDNYIAILPARSVDLTGRIEGIGVVRELVAGVALSSGGRVIFAVPSRNREGKSNFSLSIEHVPDHISNRESQSIVATEYGIAYLMGKTVRERALSLIDIAHPDDRAALVQEARDARILYQDQVYSPAVVRFNTDMIDATHTFGDGLTVRFRAIKPSDEAEMRRLFYRFSAQSIYNRYFNPIHAMPHRKMQEYVNVDWRTTVSIVGVIKTSEGERIIGEARYILLKDRPYADAALIVDDAYQGKGIASYMLDMLIVIARGHDGIDGFTTHVLADNKAVLRVARKTAFPVRIVPDGECYELTISFIEKQ